MILDAGFLIALVRGDREAWEFGAAALRRETPLRSTHPVVAQVWRDRAPQARLARFLRNMPIHPLDDGREVGLILERAGTADVIDAHLVALAMALSEPVLTSDTSDLEALAARAPASNRPRILSWS